MEVCGDPLPGMKRTLTFAFWSAYSSSGTLYAGLTVQRIAPTRAVAYCTRSQGIELHAHKPTTSPRLTPAIFTRITGSISKEHSYLSSREVWIPDLLHLSIQKMFLTILHDEKQLLCGWVLKESVVNDAKLEFHRIYFRVVVCQECRQLTSVASSANCVHKRKHTAVLRKDCQ